jgi:hypothetical protein
MFKTNTLNLNEHFGISVIPVCRPNISHWDCSLQAFQYQNATEIRISSSHCLLARQVSRVPTADKELRG